MRPCAAAKEYLRTFYHKNHLNYVLSLLLFAVGTVVSLFFTWLLSEVVNTIYAQDMGRLGELLLMAAVFLPTNFLLLCAGYRVKTRFVHKALRQYKELAFRRLAQKDISAFARENTARYLSALTNDASSIEENYLNRSILLLIECFQALAALVMMLCYHWVLTAAAVALSSLPIVLSLVMGKELTSRERTVSVQNELFTGRLKDLLGGFSVLKSFKAEGQAIAIFDRENQALEEKKERKRAYAALLSAAAQHAGLLVQMGIFFLGAWFAIRGSVSIGTVIVFTNLCNYIVYPLQTVPEYWATRKAAVGLIDKFAELSAQNSGRGGQTMEPVLREPIRFEHVSFAYEEGKPVLEDVSLSFAPGKSYAIVGTSGSGKTTLLNLLMGAYGGYSGSLAINGRQVRDIDSDSLYELMSLIGQDVFLFDDSIRANITMFRDFPDEMVRLAVEKAGLTGVMAQRGEDYRCGENGGGLSGGERQRIAIARSLLRGAQVLLLDEATSALDAETAGRVTQAILDQAQLTRIVVTHRLEQALLRRYDEIIVLKNGRVAERGGFQELLERKGQFYSLYTVANG